VSEHVNDLKLTEADVAPIKHDDDVATAIPVISATSIKEWKRSLVILLCAICMAVWRLYGDAIVTEFHFYTTRGLQDTTYTN